MDGGASSVLRRKGMAANILRIVVLIALAFPATGSVQAAGPWYVAPGGNDSNSCLAPGAPCLTINGAISKASAGDIIRVAIGTYTGSGDEVVLINKNINLQGGWDENFTTQNDRSTIDGESGRRGVTVNSGLTVTIHRVVIQHGVRDWPERGGGILNGGTLTLNNSILSGNASWEGGGIYNAGSLTVNDATIQDNVARRIGYVGAEGGGGIGTAPNSTTTIQNSTLSGNTVGGGFQGGAINTLGSVILSNSTVSGNSGYSTGVIRAAASGASLVVNNSTISGNTGYAAIYIYLASLTMNNSTVVSNESGIFNHLGSVSLRNSVLALNAYLNCSGPMTSGGYNLIGWITSECPLTPGSGDILGTFDNPIDPRLAPLADNGGPTLTHALLGNSPARNAGNPAAPGSGGDACLAADQRGVSRPFGEACDIGAYEGDVLLVKSLDRTDPSPTSAYTVHYTLKFTDSATGVDTVAPFNDFGLAVAGPTGAAVTAVSGSGDTYEVTVYVGTGTGTVQLNVLDDDTILDLFGHPLGGAGLGNGASAGPEYTIVNPLVISILRASPNPTSASSVNFKVKFSEPVTGVNNVAPFSDFALTTTGVTGAAIVGVSGSGTSYAVTVNTGQRNGTIQLKLADDDSILSAFNRPLGGLGSGNGSFTGPTFTARKIPTILSPVAITTWDRSPSYRWSNNIPAVTKYSFQVWKGTRLVSTRTVSASTCIGTTCIKTASLLLPAAYKWRVRAEASGIWQPFSAFKPFTVLGPKAGYWKSTWSDFYVTADKANVKNFSIYIYVPGCGSYKITHTVLAPINNRKFSFSGPFYAWGTFATTGINASGMAGLSSFPIPGCGYVSGGPYGWQAAWTSADQPAPGAAVQVLPLLGPEGTFPGSFTVEPFEP